MKLSIKNFLPILIGLLLLGIPLLRDFHFESAMLAGIIGCFWAGIRSSQQTAKQDFFSALKILGLLFLAGLPLFVYSLITGCLTIDGIGFWLFIPLPSVFFGTAIGRLTRKFRFPFPKTGTILVLLFCAIGLWLIEFFTFPQVYFYNHVWGVWPGPIYDEAVHLTGSFFYFRWLTFLWIVMLWVIPVWSRNRQTKLITALTLLSLIFSYTNLDEAGIISPRQIIQQQLGGEFQTKHFELFYDDTFYSTEEISYWAARHEFHFQQIIEQLNITWPDNRKIESYLYAHAWQKKKITGAKFTSYVPIWLEKDQLHIAKQQLDDVLKHELVHVVSKQFGNNLFNGSWNIGLIEGLAEGIAKDASSRSTLHQIVAAEKPYPTAEEIQSALSMWGFYGSAGAISYTTMGSFTEYLLAEYPAGYFKEAYKSANIKSAYPKPVEELVSVWHQTLDNTPLDSVDRQVSEFIFAQRSLFEKPCPHSVDKGLRLWDTYQFQLSENDSSAAYNNLDELYVFTPDNDLVLEAWVRSQLVRKNYAAAVNAISSNDTLLTLQVLKTDALYLAKGYQKADSLLKNLAPDIQSSTARNFRYTLEMRQDSLQWLYHTNRRFATILPDSSEFHSHNLPNQMLSLNKAVEENRPQLIFLYASLLLNYPTDTDWFDIYEATINKLAYHGHFELSKKWIERTSSLNLRLRYSERLQEQQEWVNFLSNYNAVAD
ncbi:MAG: hypothetical protein HUJ22_11315 [Gracilimonas sp.]|uniref:hypothetical protein n=1 Tax=Gracilimonas sp. TaxID=1974203 RepID=UPI0019B90F54|nr:hypothetical protein [Gracilimonas sp.]MBD3617148.1 hypothetical protein [Gracilimonas sp.]